MTEDATFERDLRAMLAARDPGPPPGGLAATVRDRLAVDRPSNRLVSIGRWAGAALVTAMAAVLIVAIVVSRPIATGPGATPLPSSASSFAIRAGDGVISEAQHPVFQAIAGLVAAGVLLRLFATTTVRWRRVASILGILVIGLIATTIGTSNAVGFVVGVYGVEPGREGSPDTPGMYVAVTGDSPFTMVLTVTNTSRLPLDVRGIETDRVLASETGRVILPRFVGAGLVDESSLDTRRTEQFQPFVLEPGEARTLAFLGMAGACAIPSVGPEGQAGYSLETVKVVYEQLTIEHEAVITLPEPVVITTPGTCF